MRNAYPKRSLRAAWSWLAVLGILLCQASLKAQTWPELEKITAPNRDIYDYFGKSVAMSGDYAIVTASGDNEDAMEANPLDSPGAAYILEYSGTSWDVVQKIVASDRDEFDDFGTYAAISGDYAVVTASFEDDDHLGQNPLSNAGSAYVFHRQGGTWTQTQKITASDRGTSDFFGTSAAMDGNYLLIGTPYQDEDAQGGNTLQDAGAVYVYENQGGTWVEIQMLTAADRDANDFFGSKVDIHGNYAIVGARYEDEDPQGANTLADAGSAYIFQNVNGTWTQVQKITAADRASTDNFGSGVGIFGDYAIVGASFEDEDENGVFPVNDAGSAYIFQNISGTWTQVQKIVAADRRTGDFFGSALSISGDHILIGAHKNSFDANNTSQKINAGAAYLYENNGGTWTQIQKLVASDRDSQDLLGTTVAISDDFILLGADSEDHDVNGGNQIFFSGSAYVYGTCAFTSTEPVNACYEYTWPLTGQTYTSSGMYYSTAGGNGNCDTLFTLDLSVFTVNTNVSQNGTLLTAQAAGGSHQWLDCNNGYAAIPGATSQSYTAPAPGSYAVEITMNGCVDTSACYAVTNVGRDLPLVDQVTISPNPSRGEVLMDLGQHMDGLTVRVFNVMGQEVLRQSFGAVSEVALSLDGKPGVYFIHLENELGMKASFKVIKQ